ncbi:MAG: hypothetical protein HRT57_05015 [Crocinitomicaceae bacterium]|nr:hypothetical protein [Crocinitomicaceae bacterium]
MKISIIFWIASAFIFGIPFFINNGLIIFLITLASFLFGLKYYLADRRDLKSAIYYVRMPETKTPLPILKSLISVIILIGILILVQWVFDDFFPDFTLPSLSSFYLLPTSAAYLPQHYHKFKNSFRTYKSGIKLPRSNQDIINWKNVEQISFENTTLTIKANRKENHYIIDARDGDDLERIIVMWQNERIQEEKKRPI